MILKWAHHGQSWYDELTTAPDYRDGFLHVPDTPGIGIEVRDEVVNDRRKPGYPAI